MSVESNTNCIENENIPLVDNQDDGITDEVAIHDNSDDNQSKIPSTASVRNDSGKFMKIRFLLIKNIFLLKSILYSIISTFSNNLYRSHYS